MVSRTVLFILAVGLSLAASGHSAVPTREKPVITAAFANAPRALTVSWAHNDVGVYGFAIQFNEQNSWRDVQRLDHTFAQTTLVFLEPNTLYTLRVCAVYGPDGESDMECSATEPQVRTMPEASPGTFGAAPTIVRREVSQTTIKIWWQSPSYGFFHVRWKEQGGGETEDRINSAGDHGYHEKNNLRSGTTYVFRMQGCNRTLFSSSCGSWGTPIEIRTADPPLETPGLNVLPPHSPSGIKLGWTGSVNFTNTNVVLYRDGRVVHDARASSGMNNPHIDFAPRPNTDYSYTLCFVRQEWKCSDKVSAAGQPVAPTAPRDQHGEIYRPVGPIIRGQLPPPRAKLKWTNTEIPGRFIVVERVEFRSGRGRGRGTTGPPIINWAEVTRVNSRSDPTEIEFDLANTGVRIPQSNEYRICSVVPSMGNAGKVCTPKFTVN